MENIEAQVVKSLYGEDIELYDFIPYLLQDLWEIGASPEVIIDMVKRHIGKSDISVLDLGCGKGAVSVKLAKAVGCKVKGIDALKDFIEYAEDKAREYGVSNICKFVVGDIRECYEEDYDLIIFAACGDIFGDLDATVVKLKAMVKNGGYIIIDDAFCEADKQVDGYITHEEVINAFKKNKLELIEESIIGNEALKVINDANNRSIALRATELKIKHPEKSWLFDNYIWKQLEECKVLETQVKCATWLLKKVE